MSRDHKHCNLFHNHCHVTMSATFIHVYLLTYLLTYLKTTIAPTILSSFGGQVTFLKPAQVLFNTTIKRNFAMVFIVDQCVPVYLRCHSIIANGLDPDRTLSIYAAWRLDMIDDAKINLGFAFGAMIDFQ